MFRDSGRTFARRRASLFTEKFDSEITLCCKYVITQGNFCGWEAGFELGASLFSKLVMARDFWF